jgi:hypothetical protein
MKLQPVNQRSVFAHVTLNQLGLGLAMDLVGLILVPTGKRENQVFRCQGIMKPLIGK